MKPSQTLDLALHFGSGLSPAWLFILAPLVLGLGWLLYQREIKGLAGRRASVLILLRLTLLGLVLFAAFMPSLDIVQRLAFPGRIVLVVDNSESMTVSDSTMPPVDALRLARSLDPERASVPGPRTRFHRASAHLRDLVGRVRQFQRELTRHGDDSPSLESAARALLDHSAAAFLKLDGEEANLPLDSLSEEDHQQYETAQGELSSARKALGLLGAAPRSSPTSPRELRAKLERLVAKFQELQAKVDGDLMAKGDAALTKLSDDIISTKRLELANRSIGALAPAFANWAPQQYLQVTDLMNAKTETLHAGDRAHAIASARGRTDIRGRLEAIIDEPSDFPLTGVILVSDGVELCDRPADDVLKRYVSRRVPIFCAGTGHVEEPHDLAIAEVRAPPIAIRDHAFSVEVHIKASVGLTSPGKLIVREDRKVLSQKEFELRGMPQVVYVPVTPLTEGLKHYEVELEPAAKDAFPSRNNKSAFVLEARRQGLRVLLLDDRPRWQTRFVVNILRRLPYVDANTIIRVVQKEGKLERGQFKGTWPNSSEALDIYDVVLLGSLDAEVLGVEEWRQLEAFVKERGKTLVLLAPGEATAYPESIHELLPLPPTPVQREARLTREKLRGLQLTEEGALHPLTRAFSQHLPTVPFPRISPRPESLVLLHEETASRPLVSCRLVGNGKVFMLHSDRLWVCLNRQHLQQHAAVFINLIEWASRSQSSHRLLDHDSLQEGERFQVWASGSRRELTVEDANGETVARSRAAAAQGPSGLHRAVFGPLPPGRFLVRDEAGPRAEPLYVLPDNEEVVALAQDADYLRHVSRVTGGEYRPLSELRRFLPAMDLKERAEVHRHVIQLWSSQATLLFLLLLLAVEWILRKYWGLV